MTDTLHVQTLTVGEGDDLITYDVRGDLADATADRPALFILGSPMEASYFAPLAEHFTDRPVITYDPRGTARNPRGTSPITAEQHAEDIHRVIEAVGGPVDVFASSGGAVNVLALVTAHPGDARRVVAHEPPTAALLPDRDSLLAATEDIRSTYQSLGNGPAMAKFIALVMVDGELPGDYTERPAPDPASFGMSAEDDGARDNPLMRNLSGGLNAYEPDFEALAALGERLVIAAGEDSGQQMAARGGYSVAARLGSQVATFPKGHGGFMPGDGDPDAFAARLHEVLD